MSIARNGTYACRDLRAARLYALFRAPLDSSSLGTGIPLGRGAIPYPTSGSYSPIVSVDVKLSSCSRDNVGDRLADQ